LIPNEALAGIDEKIREVVRLLNKLPFINTISSCQGHPRRGPIRCYISMETSNEEQFLNFITKVFQKYDRLDLEYELPLISLSKYYGWADDDLTSLGSNFVLELISPSTEEEQMENGRKWLERILRRYLDEKILHSM